jgi:iron complex outermembrane receptor protein
MIKGFFVTCGIGALSAQFLMSSAIAQDAAAPAETGQASQASDIKDIIVTARRRDESLSRTPIAVTAFGAEQLAQRTITSQSDLQAAVPGLTVRSTLSSYDLTYSLRGQSVEYATGSSPAVLPYVNEVQLNAGGSAALYDLGSLQVLKGPQGTLFGRNTTGGAVLFSTAKPTNDLEGFLTGRIGNYDLRQITGAINIPIVSERVLLRVAGDVRNRDGYVLNLFDGKHLGKIRSQSIRGSLTIKPTDAIESTTVVQYNHNNGSSANAGLYSAYACGTPGVASTGDCLFSPAGYNAAFGAGAWDAFLAAHPGTPPEGLAAYVATQRAQGQRVVNEDSPSRDIIKDIFVTNTTTLSIGDNMQLKNIAGYSKRSYFKTVDSDGSPYPIILHFAPNGDVGYNDKFKQFSEELQFSGSTSESDLKYIFGAFYSYDRFAPFDNVTVFDLQPIAPGANSTAAFVVVNKSYAAFGQVSYNLGKLTGVDGLTLTGGLRYTRQSTASVLLPGGTGFAANGAAPEKVSFEKPSWNVSLDYQATPNLLLYVAQRGSFRSGSINPYGPANPVPAAQGGNVVLPETTKDVELGAKYRGHLGTMPLSANIAVYNQWVHKVQRVVYVFVGAQFAGVTAGVPEATVRGFEADLTMQPARWLQIGGNATYTHARYSSPTVSLFGSTYVFGPYADTPEWSATGYVQTTFPVSGDSDLILRAEVYGQTKQYFSNLDATVNPGTELPGYATVNLRGELTKIAGTDASVALFAKNIFDKEYYTGGLPEGVALGLNQAVGSEPRTYGLEVNLKF